MLALAVVGPPPHASSAVPTSVTSASVTSVVPSPPVGGRFAGLPGADEGQPSDAEVKAAAAAAAAAHARVTRQSDQVATARTALTAATISAGLALERYREAVLRLQQAQVAAGQASDRLEQSGHELRLRQEELGGWARQAYGRGGMLTRSPTLTTLLSGTAIDDLDLTVVVLHRTGAAAGRALTRVEQAQAVLQSVTEAADDAQQAASASTIAAAIARKKADEAVQAQRSVVERLQGDLAGSQRAAADAADRAARLARARALADARARAWRNQVTGEVGSCAGGDLNPYPNGTIPLAVLCPLWGAPGEYLRADAAYAFGRLSQAYAMAFGAPACVTDSYRSYPEQVRIYADKPGLAAVPGTSNHGWGTAVDLCDGVEAFGTATHLWMLENAPAFGWFHPSWAEPGGGRPEPWHWEFAG
jgi:hypothetical protein